MLKSRPILADKLPEDGKRISIMSRHTQNDGITPDERLTSDRYDEHKPEFAAPGRLVWGYYRGEVSRDEYAKWYREHLETKQQDNVIQLIKDALVENITVMCIENTPELCHRRLFLEYAKELSDTLNLPLKIEIA